MKKILAVLVSISMVLCLAAPVFAEESAEFGLYVGTWDAGAPSLATITVTDQPAQYSITNESAFSGSGLIDMIVFKTPSGSSGLKNVKLKTVSITVDGVELTPVDGDTWEYTSDDNGNFEIIYKGGWTTDNNRAEVPADLEYTKDSKLTITFIVDPDNYDASAAETNETAPEAETTAPEAETPAPEAETTAPEAETTAPSAEAEAPAPEAEATAPAPETAAPATGIALCVIPAVVALGAVAVSKKH